MDSTLGLTPEIQLLMLALLQAHGLPLTLMLASSKYSTGHVLGSSETVREYYTALCKVYICIYVNKAYLAQSLHKFPIVLSCFKKANSF